MTDRRVNNGRKPNDLSHLIGTKVGARTVTGFYKKLVTITCDRGHSVRYERAALAEAAAFKCLGCRRENKRVRMPRGRPIKRAVCEIVRPLSNGKTLTRCTRCKAYHHRPARKINERCHACANRSPVDVVWRAA